MKKTLLTLSTLIITIHVFAFNSPNSGIIEIGKHYRQFMFRNSPPESVLNDLSKYKGTELEFAADFIKETISGNNNLLSDKYLQRPSDSTLQIIYTIREINYNIRKENPQDNNQLIQSIQQTKLPTNVLVDCYYSMLFIGYSNKTTPFDLSMTNLELNKMGLKNETEKGIVFLQAMRTCGMHIWGYMNVVKPPKYEESLSLINMYPKFNGSPYYQFLNLNFTDFELNIESPTSKQSYKAYYIDKYYDTLLSHLQCAAHKNDKDAYQNVLLGSILKEDMYYKYSKQEKKLKKLLKEYKN